MKKHFPVALLVLAAGCLLLSGSLHWLSVKYFPARELTLTPAAYMDRANLWYLPPRGNEQGALVLCPGYNKSGQSMANEWRWREFAANLNLGVVGLSFSSPEEHLRSKGYYYAQNGSGELLLQGIRKIYGRELPLYLYGFSGGGHFVARFMAWKPAAVAGWCAYSAGWWDTPQPGQNCPPGIVACGTADVRYEACLNFFRQGRELGYPWLWCALDGVEHVRNDALESFVREYFTALQESGKGSRIDLGTGRPATENSAINETGHLPKPELLDSWRRLTGQ